MYREYPQGCGGGVTSPIFAEKGNYGAMGVGGDADNLAIIHHLTDRITENPDSADYAIPMLSTLVGPSGVYPAALGVTWDSYLSGIMQQSGPSRLKAQASTYKIIERLQTQDYSGAISLIKTILANNPPDDLWLFCESELIGASLLTGDMATARQVYNDIYTRASSIDSLSVEELARMINVTSRLTLPGSSNGAQQVLGKPSSSAASPQAFRLFQNHPNPFNPSTEFTYQIENAGHVTLKIFDVLGREVATLVDEEKQPGLFTAIWDAGGFASGVYFYRLQAGTFSDTKKMLIVR